MIDFGKKQLAAGFAAITYPPLRYLEIKYTGR